MTIVIRDMEVGELESMLEYDKNDRKQFALTAENIGSLKRYIELGIPPGGFLSAVLNNDLKESCGRADMYNRRKLFEYIEWLYNNAPSSSWGSVERVTQHLASFVKIKD